MSKSPPPAQEDFYVGYLPTPPRTRKLVLGVSVCVVLGALLLGGAIASQQSDPGDGVWDTANETVLQGALVLEPYPALLIPRELGGQPVSDDAPYETVHLVLPGKFGAQQAVQDLGPGPSEARGALIQRRGMRMLELKDIDAVRRLEGPPADLVPADAQAKINPAVVSFTGEIIDPKCYLGVMKPGHGRTHKACGMLCIRGGIPPMFKVDGQPDAPLLLLADDQGGSAQTLALEYFAEPVRITGRIETRGDLQVFRVNPDGVGFLD
ncbi:MAG: hypothetical protein AAF288_13160 [Planctomycetota bacterium]